MANTEYVYYIIKENWEEVELPKHRIKSVFVGEYGLTIITKDYEYLYPVRVEIIRDICEVSDPFKYVEFPNV